MRLPGNLLHPPLEKFFPSQLQPTNLTEQLSLLRDTGKILFLPQIYQNLQQQKILTRSLFKRRGDKLHCEILTSREKTGRKRRVVELSLKLLIFVLTSLCWLSSNSASQKSSWVNLIGGDVRGEPREHSEQAHFFTFWLATQFEKLMIQSTEAPRPHYAGEPWKRNLVSTVRPTVHTNSSQKRSFSKTLFKPYKFENAGFAF